MGPLRGDLPPITARAKPSSSVRQQQHCRRFHLATCQHRIINLHQRLVALFGGVMLQITASRRCSHFIHADGMCPSPLDLLGQFVRVMRIEKQPRFTVRPPTLESHPNVTQRWRRRTPLLRAPSSQKSHKSTLGKTRNRASLYMGQRFRRGQRSQQVDIPHAISFYVVLRFMPQRTVTHDQKRDSVPAASTPSSNCRMPFSTHSLPTKIDIVSAGLTRPRIVQEEIWSKRHLVDEEFRWPPSAPGRTDWARNTRQPRTPTFPSRDACPTSEPQPRFVSANRDSIPALSPVPICRRNLRKLRRCETAFLPGSVAGSYAVSAPLAHPSA